MFDRLKVNKSKARTMNWINHLCKDGLAECNLSIMFLNKIEQYQDFNLSKTSDYVLPHKNIGLIDSNPIIGEFEIIGL